MKAASLTARCAAGFWLALAPAAFAVSWLALAPAAFASSAALAATVHHGSARDTRFTPPRIEAARAPRIDGVLDEAVWLEAAVLDSFTYFEPEEGVPDSLGTIALLLYDSENLYVGLRCPDARRNIRAPLVSRDRTDEGDVIAIGLDTFCDRQRSMVFGANPLGVQFDGLNSDAEDFDDAPDFQYVSRGRVSEHGWELEMAIPFRSLRFPRRDTLEFGIEVLRITQRDGGNLFWAPVTSDVSSFHAQWGTMAGLTGIAPGRNLELTPYATSQAVSEREGAALRPAESEHRAGGDLKYGLTSNLILDVTANPDFSQIESDAGVIELNQRFAIFLPEKRPFFLESSDIFQGPLGLVYTRRIQDPIYGVKLTGKSGRTTIGALNALDRADGEPVETLPDRANPYLGHDASYGILRLKRDVFESSYVGVLGGVRENLETYNRGAGVDARVAAGSFRFDGQSVWSWSRARDYRDALAGLTPTELAGLDEDVLGARGAITEGSAWTLRGGRETRSLEVSAFVEDFSRHFAADMGFIPRTDVFNWGGEVGHAYFGGENRWFSRFEQSLSATRTHEHEGAPFGAGRLLDEELEAELRLQFKTASDVGAGVSRLFTYHEGAEFPDQWRGWVFGGSDYLGAIHSGGFVSFGDDVVFDERAPGRSLRTEVGGQLRFSPQVRLEFGLNGVRLWRANGNTRFADEWIPRLRLDWQFTRELSLRWIGQIEAETRWNEDGTLADRSRDLTSDVLGTWLLRPGTAFYLGYGTSLEGAELRGARPRTNRFFVKASWLFQL